ncbi:alpha-1D adrenergic receptor [Elysia marginata]|uniref:Alpha-1D adrenergic receptor n=1 Tax=Elysia marginata TaxID=1093978 RepID=A0AAV4JC96_9GAST|nr:alpha-1D adrenergic receptor [Elysia marginata]
MNPLGVSRMKDANQTQETLWYPPNKSKSNAEEFHPSSYERGFITSANVGIFLCSLGILFNGTLLVVLCRSRRMRLHYLYLQISSIALADLSFIVMVDSFTVYFEMQPWRLGAGFCKAWMILDVALPAVSLIALLLLNVDRVLFTYKNKLYYCLMRRPVSRLAVILSPWVVSCTVVCSLWLGFPEVQPQDGLCMYGITEEANSASSWLMVFLPSLLIFVLIIFIFIAFIGEMPPATNSAADMTFAERGARRACQVSRHIQAGDSSQRQSTGLMSFPKNTIVCSKSRNSREQAEEANGSTEVKLSPGTSHMHANFHCPRLTERMTATLTLSDNGRTHKRFISALLAVDFFSLAITLPYSAFSLVNPVCTDTQSCESLRSLFQTLSWMRSSAACVRPLLFFLLTDIWSSTKQNFMRCCTHQAEEMPGGYDAGRLPQDENAHIQLNEIQYTNRSRDNRTGVDNVGEISMNKHFDGFGNLVSKTNASATIEEMSELGGFISPETSVTMSNWLTATPPSSPSTVKQGKLAGLRDTANSDNTPKVMTHWLQDDTAATAV